MTRTVIVNTEDRPLLASQLIAQYECDGPGRHVLPVPNP